MHVLNINDSALQGDWMRGRRRCMSKTGRISFFRAFTSSGSGLKTRRDFSRPRDPDTVGESPAPAVSKDNHARDHCRRNDMPEGSWHHAFHGLIMAMAMANTNDGQSFRGGF
jgi:hypothetical protein